MDKSAIAEHSEGERILIPKATKRSAIVKEKVSRITRLYAFDTYFVENARASHNIDSLNNVKFCEHRIRDQGAFHFLSFFFFFKALTSLVFCNVLTDLSFLCRSSLYRSLFVRKMASGTCQ